MPWLETAPMEQRTQFVEDVRRGHLSVTQLCARYGISRKTGYKWLGRYAEGGRRGLGDRSRAPHHCPHRIGDSMAELICAARTAHPDWGAEKLLDWLAPRHPAIRDWPAVSTAADLLARRGFVTKRRRRRAAGHPGVVPITTAEPNDLWTADFKGSSRPATGSTATLSRSPTGTRGSCSPATGCSRPRRSPRGPPSSARSASTGCRARSGRTTACRSPRRRSTGSRT